MKPRIIRSMLTMNIHKEEQYLKQRFGLVYQDYMAKVKQIIPFVW